MGKYIIELEDSESVYKTIIANGYPMLQVIVPAPYTEPDLEQVRKEAYDKCMDEAEMSAYKLYSPKIDEAYQKGLSEAWDAARKIIHMPEADLLNLFTECYSAVCTSVQVFLKYDVSECIEKIRQYEQEREMDGLRQNIQTIVDKCGYSLDEIATVLEKMRGKQDG